MAELKRQSMDDIKRPWKHVKRQVVERVTFKCIKCKRLVTLEGDDPSFIGRKTCDSCGGK